jgi:hypothetical protein
MCVVLYVDKKRGKLLLTYSSQSYDVASSDDNRTMTRSILKGKENEQNVQCVIPLSQLKIFLKH